MRRKTIRTLKEASSGARSFVLYHEKKKKKNATTSLRILLQVLLAMVGTRGSCERSVCSWVRNRSAKTRAITDWCNNRISVYNFQVVWFT